MATTPSTHRYAEAYAPGIMVGESSAIMPTVWTKDDEGRKLVKHWRTIGIDYIIQIGDMNETIEGKHRKRK